MNTKTLGFLGSLGQNSKETGAMAGGWTYRAQLPLWFSSMIVSFNNFSSLICVIFQLLWVAKFIIKVADETLL